jgi:quercetin dioxygenase-like cupin family protein
MNQHLVQASTNEKDAVSGHVQILAMAQVKLVEKPWGSERWIADGNPIFPYSFKEIFIKAQHRSSIQFHQAKQETNYVQKGRGILYYSKEPIDVDAYLQGQYTQEKLDDIINSLERQELTPGIVFHVFPGLIHRIEAVEDLTMLEASSVELDDVFRLKDDTSRGDGRIAAEHR